LRIPLSRLSDFRGWTDALFAAVVLVFPHHGIVSMIPEYRTSGLTTLRLQHDLVKASRSTHRTFTFHAGDVHDVIVSSLVNIGKIHAEVIEYNGVKRLGWINSIKDYSTVRITTRHHATKQVHT
jgi:hypothetical protein